MKFIREVCVAGAVVDVSLKSNTKTTQCESTEDEAFSRGSDQE